jgi:hypothetical protein
MTFLAIFLELAYSATRFKSTATAVKKCERDIIAAAVLLFPVAGITAQATAFLPLPLLLVVWLLVLWKSVRTLYGIFSWE